VKFSEARDPQAGCTASVSVDVELRRIGKVWASESRRKSKSATSRRNMEGSLKIGSGPSESISRTAACRVICRGVVLDAPPKARSDAIKKDASNDCKVTGRRAGARNLNA
jgi:hypothetical protein